jgi:hypothetical protein
MERSGIISKVKLKMDEVTPPGVDLPFDDLIGPTLDDCAKEILMVCPLHLITPSEIPIVLVRPVAHSLTREVHSNVALITTTEPHSFFTGDSIKIEGFREADYLTGSFVVLAGVPGDSDFTFAVTHENTEQVGDLTGLISWAGIPTLYFENNLAYLLTPSDFLRLYEIKFPSWVVPVRETTKIDSDRGKIQDNPYLKAGTGRPVVIIKDTKPTAGSLGKWLVCGKVAASNVPTTALYIKEHKPEDLPDKLIDALTWLTASKVLQISGSGDLSQGLMAQYQSIMVQLSKA